MHITGLPLLVSCLPLQTSIDMRTLSRAVLAAATALLTTTNSLGQEPSADATDFARKSGEVAARCSAILYESTSENRDLQKKITGALTVFSLERISLEEFNKQTNRALEVIGAQNYEIGLAARQGNNERMEEAMKQKYDNANACTMFYSRVVLQ